MSGQLPMIDDRAVAIFKAIERRLGVSFEAMLARESRPTTRLARRRSLGRARAKARNLAAFLLRNDGWEWDDISEMLQRSHLGIKWSCRVALEPKYAADLAAIRAALPQRQEAGL